MRVLFFELTAFALPLTSNTKGTHCQQHSTKSNKLLHYIVTHLIQPNPSFVFFQPSHFILQMKQITWRGEMLNANAKFVWKQNRGPVHSKQTTPTPNEKKSKKELQLESKSDDQKRTRTNNNSSTQATRGNYIWMLKWASHHAWVDLFFNFLFFC